MSKTKISEFSSDPALNTDIDGINIAEGCAPSGINNAIRELMAQLKDWQSGTSLDTFNTNYMIATAVDINGGAIDGATIGAASAAAGTFTTATATTVNSTTVDTTNLEVTNIKAKDGTAAGSIADSTGVVTLASSVLTTTDINGGTIDNTAIGGATPATGAFTTLSASSTVTLSGGTANGVAYLDGSKVLTSGSALTFDGSKIAVNTSTSNIQLTTTVNTNQAYISLADADGRTAVFRGPNSGAPNCAQIGTVTNHETAFLYGNTEQMRLTSTGLGIGTSSPGAKLHVYAGGNNEAMRLDAASTFNTGVNWYNNGTIKWASQVLGDGSNAFRWYNFTSNSEAMRLDSSGNLGLGVTPSAGSTHIDISTGGSIYGLSTGAQIGANTYFNGVWLYRGSGRSARIDVNAGDTGGIQFFTASSSGTAGNAISFTQAMTLTANSNLALGVTSELIDSGRRLSVVGGTVAGSFKVASTSDIVVEMWNAATSGNNIFSEFKTEASPTLRGSITYNRAGGLVAYNTTSDYRAKDIIGPVNDSGAVIDSTPVYMGKMKGATQERPMFIAHETPDYAHTGEKDAVDADGNPVYQQMDASALVPVLWAEIQSLRKRLAAAGI